MNKKFFCLIVTVLCIAMLAGCAADPADDTTPAEPSQETEPENLAPNFTVVDEEGNEHQLSDYLGTPVVLNFWASWCGPCKMEMPEFEDAYAAYGDRVQFMMINLTDGRSETVETATEYISGQGYTFPLFFDTSMDAAYAYSISSIPMTCFIDTSGVLVDVRVGMISADTLEAGIEEILPQ